MSNQESNQERASRRVITGVVSSDKMDQTITVRVERMFKHPKYHKYIRKHSKAESVRSTTCSCPIKRLVIAALASASLPPNTSISATRSSASDMRSLP